MLRGWRKDAGLDWTEYGIHSIRRTKTKLIYRRTKNLRAVQLLLGHSRLERTTCYRGNDVDDVLEISEQTELSRICLPRRNEETVSTRTDSVWPQPLHSGA